MEKNTVNNKEQYEIILKLYNGLCKNLKIINQKFEKNADDNEISQLALKQIKLLQLFKVVWTLIIKIQKKYLKI